MSLYTLALFVHASGAIGTFVSLGTWLFGLAALRRARLVAILLGIVFLMTTKPSLVVSLLAMAAAIVLGLASSLPFWSEKLRLPQRTAARGTLAEADPFLKTTIWTRRW